MKLAIRLQCLMTHNYLYTSTSQMKLLPLFWSPLTCCEAFELFIFHSSQEEGQGRLAIGSVNWHRAHTAQSKWWKEGVLDTTRTKENLENAKVLLNFFASGGTFTCLGMEVFGTRSVYYPIWLSNLKIKTKHKFANQRIYFSFPCTTMWHYMQHV